MLILLLSVNLPAVIDNFQPKLVATLTHVRLKPNHNGDVMILGQSGEVVRFSVSIFLLTKVS